ncbi:Hypothetical protein, putative [Bodo saltans]|uniref:Uncharacterized protein n=1 Tax=Bodo saltans TaxID=75058 RepID=A0A0S4INC5_BODSA|nr:Hypothetical protein, putative [Bodo saltans]|eukprot:CUF65048.1 Hypothetical protein, putative [Bodo saltans]
MHHPSVSTCSISPRCGSARRAEEASSLSRPGTGRRVLATDSPRGHSASRPTSSSHKKIELFYLTRPSSGYQRRQLEAPLFAEDVAIQRSRVSSARVQRSAVASDPETPTHLPAPQSADTTVHFQFPQDAPEVRRTSNPCVNWQDPEEEEVTFTVFHHQPAPPLVSSSASTLPFSPLAMLQTLRTQRSSLRRPSRLPTPPVIPPIEDLISGGGRRRVSLFPQYPSRKDEVTEQKPRPLSSSDHEVDLADAETGIEAFQFRSGSPLGAARSTLGPLDRDEDKPQEAINADQARKRAFYAKMNDVIAINAGVHLTIPSFPSLPHFQTMHPLDLAREVNTSELPYSLRVGGYSPNVATARGDETNAAGVAALENRRGFMSVAQWRREGRASNFVMPPTCNPGPVVASGWSFTTRK